MSRSEQFSKTFHEGVDAFIKGDWTLAEQKINGATDFCPKARVVIVALWVVWPREKDARTHTPTHSPGLYSQDVPSKLLLKEMKKRSSDPNTLTAPIDWKGYHDSEV